MTDYTTATALLERTDARELALVAPPESGPVVDPELMRAVILDTDTSAWSADEIAAAEQGLARIIEAVDDANRLVDAHVGRQYTLPLDPVPEVLKRPAADIARYHLHDDHATDEIRRRYEGALKLLLALGRGEISLGIEQPPSSKAGSATIESAPARWRRGDSDGYL